MANLRVELQYRRVMGLAVVSSNVHWSVTHIILLDNYFGLSTCVVCGCIL